MNFLRKSVNHRFITYSDSLYVKKWREAKVTDIDRPKGIFTDHRAAGDFIRRITKTVNL